MCEDRLRGADSDSLLASHVRRRAGLLSGGDGERIVFPNSCFSRLASRPCAVPSGRRAFSIFSECDLGIFASPRLALRPCAVPSGRRAFSIFSECDLGIFASPDSLRDRAPSLRGDAVFLIFSECDLGIFASPDSLRDRAPSLRGDGRFRFPANIILLYLYGMHYYIEPTSPVHAASFFTMPSGW